MGRERFLAAALLGMLAVAEKRPGAKLAFVDDGQRDPSPEPPKEGEPLQYPYYNVERQVQRPFFRAPPSGTGKRQGERLARQKLDFSASEKCIARIKTRLGVGDGCK